MVLATLLVPATIIVIPTYVTIVDLEGADSWQMHRHVVLPLSQSILVVICIFSVIASWKGLLWPKIILPSPSRQPYSVALDNLASSVQLSPVLAALLIASVPPLVACLFLQKHHRRPLRHRLTK